MRRLLAFALTALLLLTGCASSAPDTAGSGTSGLPTAALTDLPREAQQTYDLIVRGGPYPYSKDGAVFGNREGLLPQQDYGWYREYTVQTPGSGDRGARRFVVGEDDTAFYTDDHYESFREVIP